MKLVKHKIRPDDTSYIQISSISSHSIGNREKAGKQLIDGAKGQRCLHLRIVSLFTGLNRNSFPAELPVLLYQACRSLPINITCQRFIFPEKLISEHT